ncbi:MAG: (2Fe-2S)-binding protein [Rhodospirillales bacterium]|nr:(2Fe-2S)-binding protein [Rhodospirillales bacterium]MDP6645799.1 (2Fe-2S)-binding protein [Rhodospirillales bacterium]
MTEYIPPDERFLPEDFDYEAAAELDEAPVNPITELARTETSRRSFIKGAIASGAAVSAAGFVFRGAGSGAMAQTVKPKLVSLSINGKTRRVDAMPQETLAFTLRYKLGLTGTKLGCDRSECGACTVLIDGVPTYSCSTLTHSVRAGKVTTIEGVKGKNGGLHPIQKAMVEELAPQCGFCTPGIVVSAVALLEKNKNPSRDDVRQALSGNLCRCGAYDHHTNAVLRAAKEV